MNIKGFFSKKKSTIPENNIPRTLGFSLIFASSIPSIAPILKKDSNEFTIKNNNVDTYISAYSQKNIKSGATVELQNNLEQSFKESIKLVNKFFNEKDCVFIDNMLYSENILFLEPIINIENNSHGEKELFSLPSVFTTATFDKFGERNYTLRVAWWQNSYGMPEKNIIEQLEKVEWKESYIYHWHIKYNNMFL